MAGVAVFASNESSKGGGEREGRKGALATNYEEQAGDIHGTESCSSYVCVNLEHQPLTLQNVTVACCMCAKMVACTKEGRNGVRCDW